MTARQAAFRTRYHRKRAASAFQVNPTSSSGRGRWVPKRTGSLGIPPQTLISGGWPFASPVDTWPHFQPGAQVGRVRRPEDDGWAQSKYRPHGRGVKPLLVSHRKISSSA